MYIGVAMDTQLPWLKYCFIVFALFCVSWVQFLVGHQRGNYYLYVGFPRKSILAVEAHLKCDCVRARAVGLSPLGGEMGFSCSLIR